MNGEIMHLCLMVVSIRKALCNNTLPILDSQKYISSITYELDNRSTTSFFSEWYEKALNAGLQDVKLLLPIRVKNRAILGFVNTSQACMTCYYENRKPMLMIPEWEYLKTQKAWRVVYHLSQWNDAPVRKPVYHDHSEDFKQVLNDTAKLADTLHQSFFADIFRKQYDVLCGTDDRKDRLEIGLAEPYAGIFSASAKADVFGAMGSWNDTPPCIAEEMGLLQEYEQLSDKLLEQIRLNTMYAVNEGGLL